MARMVLAGLKRQKNDDPYHTRPDLTLQATVSRLQKCQKPAREQGRRPFNQRPGSRAGLRTRAVTTTFARGLVIEAQKINVLPSDRICRHLPIIGDYFPSQLKPGCYFIY